MNDGGDSPVESGRRGGLRVLAYVVGVGLLAAAVFAVVRGQGAASAAFDSVRSAPAGLLLLAAALPLLSLCLVSLTFWTLTTRYGKVGRFEMFALIGSAWLLNYLPLWPGMFGRLAYHKAVNRISLQSAAVGIIWANVLAAVACAMVLGATALGSMFFRGDDWRLALVVGLLAPAMALLGVYARAKPPNPDPQFWRLPMTLAVRLVETQVWAARYAVCFALVGTPIGWGASLAVASATQAATLIPLTGNALGVREWAVGLVTPLIPVGLALTTAANVRTGLSAEIVNRGIEVLLAIPVGLLCAAWVARRVKARAAVTAAAER